ncbi:bifunctional methylenetetrahydrofolate dehydrogenase/methenyltetrahydrofolate cyclohydrolase FolD [Ileibacterium valens]|uniref:Bifunctional protein FolD n=2 Tax=Ileibacterium valens TaxID=1862668 RepID=A0A1U7ND11_9FIRM|nr:bifunctional methylenetetrahydrofolate dehydrogenase/methenyltetrahydrofolate cyclohydrolase [Ileibacterium valens]OLU39017.1 bifunctional methylenetetrahydrofolate dehydrogenase/methenyltetrahydrofolate cyclohydrolase [Erysipelotrichaceae bacterium NYU-BL-F16]OLU41218.1 bifunctional methylenetetrahydrofolate dehydrogenase/methenyltetrahydrofolate cyclohydrolase [Erysipelotrichaceae bacterium NYU-BL-E8]
MIIYGSELSSRLKSEMAAEVEALKKEGRRVPGLSVILVGDNPASQSYVKSKGNACHAVGMENRTIVLDGNISQKELTEVIAKENADPEVDGILVQLPLPEHLSEREAVHAISPDKDVDGLHPVNAGALLLGEEGFVPCTPKGVMEILKEAGLEDLSGKTAVVCGRSNLVGKPLALLLQKANATVTTVHSRTPNMKEICRQADILVAAIGVPEMIDEEYVKDGAVVIDVGINRVDGKLKGDVAFDRVRDLASVITPVPKGVGPMTVCMLLANTLGAYKRHEKETVHE